MSVLRGKCSNCQIINMRMDAGVRIPVEAHPRAMALQSRLRRGQTCPVSAWTRAIQSAKHVEEVTQVLVTHVERDLRHWSSHHPQLKGRLRDPSTVHVFARRYAEHRPHHTGHMLRRAPRQPE